MRRSTRRFSRLARNRRGATASGDPPGATPIHDGSAEAGSAEARYDKLTVDQVLANLDALSATDLARLGHYERAHRNRAAVLAHIDARLGHEPWPGYDSLDVDGVRFGLDGAERDRFVTVLAYERAHQNRAEVLLAAQQRSSAR